MDEFMACEETINIWIENFYESGVTLEEEIDDIKAAIDNERIWRDGSNTQEQKDMHSQNVADYMAYLEWLEEQEV